MVGNLGKEEEEEQYLGSFAFLALGDSFVGGETFFARRFRFCSAVTRKTRAETAQTCGHQNSDMK